ncbi:MAG: hypothetical protein LUB59_00510 [Candidatus Gastranaerophilales bacterium]|nr:hypothetical protein [Candidatus Gastranaerophilales bacterium]
MAGIVSLLTKVLVPGTSNATTTQYQVGAANGNPFGNPFVNTRTYSGYAQNRPVSGGYFAGYYNNKPNIVGQRLFVEV